MSKKMKLETGKEFLERMMQKYYDNYVEPNGIDESVYENIGFKIHEMRNEMAYYGVKYNLDLVKNLKKENGFTAMEAIEFLKVLEIKRGNDITVRDGDLEDENMMGIFNGLQNVAFEVQQLRELLKTKI